MKKSPYVALAHRALKDHDKSFIDNVFKNVNLTKLEREIVTKTVIEGADIESSCMELETWNKRNDISYDYCAKIKSSGMNKIGEYLSKNEYIPII